MNTLSQARLTESPIYFEADGETLFGILTRPNERPADLVAIALTGGGLPSTHRNRLWVHMCRALAGLGVSAFRFDYHGIAESTGVTEEFNLAKPFLQDLEGAIAHLQGEGYQRFVLIGSCFGGRTALALGPRLSGLEGLVLIDVPVHKDAGADLALRLSTSDMFRGAMRTRTIRKVLNAKHRRRYASLMRSKLAFVGASNRFSSMLTTRWSSASEWFSKSMADVLRRKIPVLLIYGSDDRHCRQFEMAARLQLGTTLSDAGDLAQVVKLDGELHGFTRIDLQTLVIERVCSWVGTRVGTSMVDERESRDGL